MALPRSRPMTPSRLRSALDRAGDGAAEGALREHGGELRFVVSRAGCVGAELEPIRCFFGSGFERRCARSRSFQSLLDAGGARDLGAETRQSDACALDGASGIQ